MKRFFLILPTLIIFFAIIGTFQDLPRTFYQQDEWQGLGHMMVEGIEQHITGGFTPLQIFFGEGRILTRFISLPLFKISRFNIVPLVIFSIMIHFLNAILVFTLAKKIFTNRLIALIPALFFSLNSVSHQPVTWFGTSTGTLPATTFILLAIISYFIYCKNDKKRFLYFSFLFTIISFWFKEIGLFLFLFLPLMYIIFKKANVLRAVKIHLSLLVYGLGLILFRLFELFSQKEQVGVFVAGGDNFLKTITVRLILYPTTSFSQVFIPPLTLSSWASEITKIQYPFLEGNPIIGLVSQTITADLLSIFISASLLLTLLFLYRKSEDAKIVLLAVALVFLSFLPYIVLDRTFTYLESRYYYIASAGAGIILASVIRWISQKAGLLKIMGLFVFLIFLFHHASIIRAEIARQVILAGDRKAILSQIKKNYPTLGSKNIFYITGNKSFYIENLPLPLQQGPGYTLMVWYNDTGIIPKELLVDNFLWGMTEQGYREVGEAGFGYFWDFEEMRETVKENILEPENVYAFFYDGQTKTLEDITSETRVRLGKVGTWRKQ